MTVLYPGPPTNSVEINQKAKKVTLLVLMSLVFMTGLTFEKRRLGETSVLSETIYENGRFSLYWLH